MYVGECFAYLLFYEIYCFWTYVQILIYFEIIFVCGVRKCSSFILLHVVDQFPQHHLLKRLSFLHCKFLPPLSKIRCPQVCGLISGLFVSLTYISVLVPVRTVLMNVALQYSLKSGRLIPPVPFFFLKIALAIRGFLCFHTNCEIFLLVCEKYCWQLDRDCIESIECSGWYTHFHYIDSSNP